MSYKVVTVATEEKGMFNELINNDFGFDVEVLGMGKTWTGYRMKCELLYEYIEDKDDDMVVVLLDGYDSAIKKDPSLAYKIFIDKKYKFLASRDPSELSGYSRWVTEKMFDTPCQDDYFANAGMFMGYVKYLKIYLESVLSNTCKDDQRLLNKSCKELDFISVDIDEDIFYNTPLYEIRREDLWNNKSVFVSHPASLSNERYSRFVNEYTQFFAKEVLISYFLFIIIIIIFVKNYKIQFSLIIGATIILFLVSAIADKSCL